MDYNYEERVKLEQCTISKHCIRYPSVEMKLQILGQYLCHV